jgi:hypothetical protein
MVRLVVLVFLVGCGSKQPDQCELAIERLQRLEKPGVPPMNTAALIDGCRTGRLSSSDPVLRCAMDSATDEAAAACIQRGIEGVIKGTAADGEGVGVNPLLR